MPGRYLKTLLVLSALLCGTGPRAETTLPSTAALGDLEGFTLDAMVLGEEVSMLVTEPELLSTMTEKLLQAGVFADIEADPAYEGGFLSLSYEAYSVEPVIPDDYETPIRIYPISIYLTVSRPVYIQRGSSSERVNAQVWWTHVEAWALENAVQEITCLAVHKALDRFVEAYAGSQPEIGGTDQNITDTAY